MNSWQRATWTLTLTLLLFTLHNTESKTHEMSAPKIIGSRDPLVLNADDNLNITSEGEQELAWTQDVIPPFYPRDANLDITTVRKQDGRWTSTFFYRDISFDATGRYHCLIKEDPTFNTSIYVYAFSSNHLFRYTSAEEATRGRGYMAAMSVNGDIALVIPCRVTHPDIQVTLKKFRDAAPVTGIQYDPTIGFTVSDPPSYYTGMFVCTASYKSYNVSRKSYLFTYTASQYPSPRASAAREVWVSQSFDVTCSVSVNTPNCPTLKLLGYDHTGMSQGRLSRCRAKFGGGGVKWETSASWTIDDAVAGKPEYVCLAQYGERKKGTLVVVKVREPTITKFSAKQETVCIDEGADSVRLEVAVTAEPWPTITWFKDGVVVDRQNFSQFWKTLNNETTLEINNPRIVDAGRFRVEGKTINGKTRSAHIQLVVMAEGGPKCKVEVDSDSESVQSESVESKAVGSHSQAGEDGRVGESGTAGEAGRVGESRQRTTVKSSAPRTHHTSTATTKVSLLVVSIFVLTVL